MLNNCLIKNKFHHNFLQTNKQTSFNQLGQIMQICSLQLCNTASPGSAGRAASSHFTTSLQPWTSKVIKAADLPTQHQHGREDTVISPCGWLGSSSSKLRTMLIRAYNLRRKSPSRHSFNTFECHLVSNIVIKSYYRRVSCCQIICWNPGGRYRKLQWLVMSWTDGTVHGQTGDYLIP